MSTRSPRRIFPPLSHFDYEILDRLCQCDICLDFREKSAAYAAALAAVEGHRRSCKCADCRRMRKLHTAERAADERRTLYCEISWLSSRDRNLGDGCMTWITAQIQDPSRGDGWWEGRSPYFSLWSWINRYGLTVVQAVSGAVAQAASGALAMAVSGA